MRKPYQIYFSFWNDPRKPQIAIHLGLYIDHMEMFTIETACQIDVEMSRLKLLKAQ